MDPSVGGHARTPEGLPVLIVEKTQQTKIRQAVSEVRYYTTRCVLAPFSYGVVGRFNSYGSRQLYLGCVSTSISAGSPAFTRSMLRLMAGPRSLGSLMGPSLYMP